jgi:hypothetical protein
MTNQDFDRLLKGIREEAVDAGEAGARVREKLAAEMSASVTVSRLDSCSDFRVLFPEYRAGGLSEARRMLVEDHLHTCAPCRREYQGRAAVVAMPSKKPVRAVYWAAAAAVAAMGVAGVAMRPMLDRMLAPAGARATVASIDGDLYKVTAHGASPLKVGAAVFENDEVRTAKASRAVLMLRDGSRIEMSERADVAVSERWSGKTIRLERGAVMVEAAKQRRGRLEIATADCLVSVKGTIFEVASGTKGSRVSVVEGEVKVDQNGASALLHRGDQKATNASIGTTPVVQEVAWSSNAAKYAALLADFAAVGKRIDQIPGPAPRYSSKLAALLPRDTMLFASIPNLGPSLAEATSIIEEQASQSPALTEWWNEKQARQMQFVVAQVKTFSAYLGDEIVLAVPAGSKDALVLAEVKKPGLSAFLDSEFAKLRAAGQVSPSLVQNPAEAAGKGPAVMVRGDLLVMAMRPDSLARIAGLADQNGQGGFLDTGLWKRIAQSYDSGAGWIFAVDTEQIGAAHVLESSVGNSAQIAGMDNIRYLVVERKPNLGRTETSVSLDFAGTRHGLMSWLAAPGPMGSLDFVSPDASFAGSFVMKSPAAMIEQMLPALPADTAPLVNEIASTLGGEVTFAVDGPLLPMPSWKIAAEVNDAARLQAGIEKVAQQYQVTVTQQEINGRTYYSLRTPRQYANTCPQPGSFGCDQKGLALLGAISVNYVFADGYLLIAPSIALLDAAIQGRATSATLRRSAAFRSQLPQDGHTNFSGLLYYNLGTQVGPVYDQLKQFLTPEQQKSAASLVADRAPGLIYSYGEADRIVVASRTGFFGLGLHTLLGLNTKGAGAFAELLPPMIRLNGSRN